MPTRPPLASRSSSDVFAMDAAQCNAFMMSAGLLLNKNEFENLFDHFGTDGLVDMPAFLSALGADEKGENPVFYTTGDISNPNTAHLALSGVSHVDFGSQYKPFPKHWGIPPNTQMKGHNGIMRELPSGFGKGNAPMANWVKANLDNDLSSDCDTRGNKPYPFGNYSL